MALSYFHLLLKNVLEFPGLDALSKLAGDISDLLTDKQSCDSANLLTSLVKKCGCDRTILTVSLFLWAKIRSEGKQSEVAEDLFLLGCFSIALKVAYRDEFKKLLLQANMDHEVNRVIEAQAVILRGLLPDQPPPVVEPKMLPFTLIEEYLTASPPQAPKEHI